MSHFEARKSLKSAAGAEPVRRNRYCPYRHLAAQECGLIYGPVEMPGQAAGLIRKSYSWETVNRRDALADKPREYRERREEYAK